ncbi:uncharacterized protein LOC116853073 [Odontomachus brunneus]|uniref:uncharacterized protein LOC116853073 n=1 Tax=Odontomachus brunneus TaxID=486640 RepID=UPI0013F1BDF4|nr:uncharacterized protein LOC116853073 [Odontomachus brunneus]
MKSLAIIVCVLVIITMVYCFNPVRLKKLDDNMAKCGLDSIESSPQPLSNSATVQLNGKTLLCGLTKDDQIIDKDGLFSVEKSFQAIKDIVSDPAKVEQGQKIFKECYDKNMQGEGTNQEKTAKIAECTLPIMALTKI